MILTGLTYLHVDRFPSFTNGLPHFDSVDFHHANHHLRKWRVHIKGPRIYFVGPPLMEGGDPQVFVLPRQWFAERWEGKEADIGKTEAWSPVAEGKK
jgi:hypothetical protein